MAKQKKKERDEENVTVLEDLIIQERITKKLSLLCTLRTEKRRTKSR